MFSHAGIRIHILEHSVNVCLRSKERVSFYGYPSLPRWWLLLVQQSKRRRALITETPPITTGDFAEWSAVYNALYAFACYSVGHIRHSTAVPV